jgi:MOSC domain-containing protein YiiM
MSAVVIAVGSSTTHSFSKPAQPQIAIVAGLGVEGDAHAGVTVKHRSRVAKKPPQPNLRQVHLIHGELFAELAAKGFAVAPGQLGENITTSGIELLSLPAGTELRIGTEAVVRLTGLRNPCYQLDRFRSGLMAAVLDRSPTGKLIRKAGVMSVAIRSGTVRPGDPIEIELPAGPHLALEPV